jgi:putative transposase
MRSDTQADFPERKKLPHAIPPWVPLESTFFITINCIPRGLNQLATPGAAAALCESFALRMKRGLWWPRLVLCMPDHLHALMAFAPEQSMAKSIRDWKRYTARQVGMRWQRDFFDHRIRHEASLIQKWDYILNNPIRAGLASDTADWPYWWTAETLLKI